MGSVNLDNTGSGSAITLSSDGTSLLLDGTAIGGGGGGADLYAANESSPSAQPSATGTNAIAIGDSAVSTGTDSFALGKARATGDRSFAVNTSTNSAYGATTGDCIAIGEFAKATTSMAVAIGRSASATGSQSLGLGFVATATGENATAIQRGLASGAHSFAAHITNSTTSYGTSGANSIGMGYRCKATGSGAVSIGYNNSTSGNYAVTLGGSTNTASAVGSFAMGFSCIADASYSYAIGQSGKTNGIMHKHAVGLNNGQQSASYRLGHNTTDATPIALNTQIWTPSAANQITLPNNSVHAFSGTVVARQQAADGTASAAWKVEGLIRREANAGSTVLVASTVTAISNIPSWGLALTADTSFGCLKVEATGASSTDIRWVATINTSEVTYA